jgi:type IV secretion system protein VirB5
MKFRRAVQRYGQTPGPVTPYQRAAQAWDDRIGSARVQARNWRIMALGGLVLSAGLSAGLLWQSLQSRVVPYVVAVDRLGEPRAIAPAERDYQPTDPQLAWFLAHYITNVRSVSLAPVLIRENALSAYDYDTARGARFLSA